MPKKMKNSNTDKNKILEDFINYSLKKDFFPKSIYMFCKDNDIEEKTFYKYFGSLEIVKKKIWSAFYENVMALIQKEKNFELSTPKEKLLTFYFTFFEVLQNNRSYILFSLNYHKKITSKMSQLSFLKNKFTVFASDLVNDGNLNKPVYLKHSPKLFSQAAWVQLLFLINFWIDDTSPEFEKTDLAIEKSVRTAFDVFDNTPLESIIDFGKFLWKEKISTT